MSKRKDKKFVSNWAMANYWVMMASEAIDRRALLEAQEDIDRVKERLEWIYNEVGRDVKDTEAKK